MSLFAPRTLKRRKNLFKFAYISIMQNIFHSLLIENYGKFILDAFVHSSGIITSPTPFQPPLFLIFPWRFRFPFPFSLLSNYFYLNSLRLFINYFFLLFWVEFFFCYLKTFIIFFSLLLLFLENLIFYFLNEIFPFKKRNFPFYSI